MGREQELSALEAVLARVARESSPHMVTIVGEAGVGKSRLLRELERRAAASHPDARLRTGRCLPYGSGIVYWALGEVVRGEADIVDSDSSEEAWAKLCEYVRDTVGDAEEKPERRAGQIGRSLGFDVPPEHVPGGEGDPERMRDAFFSSLRTVIEASAARRPLMLAFEDIHWADDGMLDAIEHLARWVRAPLLLLCLARDELLERRADWGGGRRNATQQFLDPLTGDDSRELVAALLGDGRARARAAGGRAIGREPAVRRGDGAPPRGGGHGRPGGAARHGAGGAGRSPRRARAVRAAAGAAGRGRGAHLLGGLAGAPGPGGGTRPSGGPAGAAGQGHPGVTRGVAPGGRARAGVQARAHPRRGVRHAPQGRPLPQALRGRALHRGARRRQDRRDAGPAGGALRPRRRPGSRGRGGGA